MKHTVDSQVSRSAIARHAMRGLVSLMLLALCQSVFGAEMTPRRLVVNGVELHYIERGAGEPLILLHGGQGDYRAWQPHMESLSPRFRVISYSRRYHYPNNNPIRKDYSALIDAEDLAALVDELRLGPVHLVGTSYGAFTALALALKRPDQVRSLVLAEPPILSWAANSPAGAPLYREFMSRTHERAAPAFAAGDTEGALRMFIDTFDGEGTFASLPQERRTIILQNARFFRAISQASDPYPNLSKDAVSRVKAPALVVRGEHTHEIDVFVSDELVRVLGAKLVVIPNAGHGSPRQNPRAFVDAVVEFLPAGGTPGK